MNAQQKDCFPGAGRYEIVFQGQLDTRWGDWFEGFTLTNETDGTTALRGPVIDQAALHGLLRRVGDLGVTLISVNLLADEPTPQPRSSFLTSSP